MTTTTTYLTAQTYADRLGLDVRIVRERLRSGAIPGALRIGGKGSTWAIPETALAQEIAGAGDVEELRWGVEELVASSAGAGRVSSRPDITSRRFGVTPLAPGHDSDHAMRAREITSPIDEARAIAGALAGVTNRPARALTDLVYGVAIAGARHYADRDGMCAACAWTYPCPDGRAYGELLDHARDQILAGAE